MFTLTDKFIAYVLIPSTIIGLALSLVGIGHALYREIATPPSRPGGEIEMSATGGYMLVGDTATVRCTCPSGSR